jgi:hypothetical protein
LHGKLCAIELRAGAGIPRCAGVPDAVVVIVDGVGHRGEQITRTQRDDAGLVQDEQHGAQRIERREDAEASAQVELEQRNGPGAFRFLQQ